MTPTGVHSGAERVLLRHALAGRNAGDHWVVAAPDGDVATALADAGIERVAVPELKLGQGRRSVAAGVLAFDNLRALGPIRKAARQADVIVANSVMCLPVLALVRPSAPIVWLVHDVITRRDLRRVASTFARCVSLSVPVSNAAAELSRTLGIETVVIRNGVELPDEPAAPVDDPPIVGLNAVLTGWKGQDVLLDAVGLAQRPCVVELLGGTLPKDGPYETKLRERAIADDLRGRVRFLGHHREPNEVMRRWSIAVSASVEPEAGPLAVLEAMALGLPVVVTSHGGAPELASDVGIVVPPSDPTALAAALDALLGSPERRHELGGLAREAVAGSYLRSDLEATFRETLAERARQR